MASFIPKPAEDYKVRKDKEVGRLKILNPDAPLYELEAIVNGQFDVIASEQWQFHERFDQRHMTEYVIVSMLSQALCEALINAILAIGLSSKGIPDFFSIVEKTEFRKKWLIGPKCFYPGYEFPTGGGMHETLNSLVKDRNALMHHKIELEMNGKKVLKGSRFDRKEYAQEISMLRRYFSLPYDLAAYIRNSDLEPKMLLLFERGPIDPAPAHEIA